MAQSKRKPKKQNGKKVDALLDKIKRHKLVFILSLILLTILAFKYPYQMYKDWDNAQLISGLARDFPLLVQEIEDATGLDLEIKSNCSTTTEKFNSGVKTCELIVSKQLYDDVEIKEFVNIINSDNFSRVTEYDNGKGYKLYYRNKDACGLGIEARGSDVYSFSCLTAVRSANTELAIEEFSKLN